jgi:hypothetical protein
MLMGEIMAAVREFLARVTDEQLAGLTDEQLAALERLCGLVEFGPPAAVRPVESLSADECVEEWRRLCRRPVESWSKEW